MNSCTTCLSANICGGRSNIDVLSVGEVEAEEAVTGDVYERHRRLRDWTLKERLQGEKDTLGLFVTGHPFDEYEKEVRQLVPTRLSHLQEAKAPQKRRHLPRNWR